MDITQVFTKNLSKISELIELEHNNKGMINGRDMIIADSEIVVEGVVTLPELFAIKAISSKFTVSDSFDLSPEGVTQGLSFFTDDKNYDTPVSSLLKSYASGNKNIETLVSELPIGSLIYTMRCSFIGSNIRILMSTGSYYDLIGETYNEDEAVARIPELFYKAVYKEMFARVSFSYDTVDKYLKDHRYVGFNDGNAYHALQISADFGGTVTMLVDVDPDESTASFGQMTQEEKDAKEDEITTGDKYLTISCKTPLYVYYIIKLSGIEVIDEEPMKNFLAKDINEYQLHPVKYDQPGFKEIVDLYAGIDRSDSVNVVRMMGLIPGGSLINYTIRVNMNDEKWASAIKKHKYAGTYTYIIELISYVELFRSAFTI